MQPPDEGLALQAFDQAGDCMLKLNPNDSYRMKMLLGEILAAAVLKNEKYRQIAPRYLAQEPDDELHPDLSFAVLRSSSKLAEIDGRLVDPSAVWSALVKLDGVGRLFLERKAAAILGARVVGKMRGSDLGDLLIHVLTTGGQASQIGAIGGITMAEERSEPVFYLRELEEIARKKSVPSAPSVPPSQRLVALLDRIARDESDFVRQVLDNRYRRSPTRFRRPAICEQRPLAAATRRVSGVSDQQRPDHRDRATDHGSEHGRNRT